MIKFKKLVQHKAVRVAKEGRQFVKDLQNLRASDILSVYVLGHEAYTYKPSPKAALVEVRAAELRPFRWPSLSIKKHNDMFREQWPHSFSPALSEQLANSGMVRYRPLIEKVGKHNDVPPSEFDPKELKMGIQHEKEHTDDTKEAEALAKDHLNPDTGDKKYYSKLMQFIKKGWLEDKD